MKLSLVKGDENLRLIYLDAESKRDQDVLRALNVEGVLTAVSAPDNDPDVCVQGYILVTGPSDADVMFLERTLQRCYPKRELVPSS